MDIAQGFYSVPLLTDVTSNMNCFSDFCATFCAKRISFSIKNPQPETLVTSSVPLTPLPPNCTCSTWDQSYNFNFTSNVYEYNYVDETDPAFSFTETIKKDTNTSNLIYDIILSPKLSSNLTVWRNCSGEAILLESTTTNEPPIIAIPSNIFSPTPTFSHSVPSEPRTILPPSTEPSIQQSALSLVIGGIAGGLVLMIVAVLTIVCITREIKRRSDIQHLQPPTMSASQNRDLSSYPTLPGPISYPSLASQQINIGPIKKEWVAISLYEPQNPDEMQIDYGDLVLVDEMHSDGWVHGKNRRTGKKGMVPVNLLANLEVSGVPLNNK